MGDFVRGLLRSPPFVDCIWARRRPVAT